MKNATVTVHDTLKSSFHNNRNCIHVLVKKWQSLFLTVETWVRRMFFTSQRAGWTSHRLECKKEEVSTVSWSYHLWPAKNSGEPNLKAWPPLLNFLYFPNTQLKKPQIDHAAEFTFHIVNLLSEWGMSFNLTHVMAHIRRDMHVKSEYPSTTQHWGQVKVSN